MSFSKPSFLETFVQKFGIWQIQIVKRFTPNLCLWWLCTSYTKNDRIKVLKLLIKFRLKWSFLWQVDFLQIWDHLRCNLSNPSSNLSSLLHNKTSRSLHPNKCLLRIYHLNKILANQLDSLPLQITWIYSAHLPLKTWLNHHLMVNKKIKKRTHSEVATNRTMT